MPSLTSAYSPAIAVENDAPHGPLSGQRVVEICKTIAGPTGARLIRLMLTLGFLAPATVSTLAVAAEKDTVVQLRAELAAKPSDDQVKAWKALADACWRLDCQRLQPKYLEYSA